MFRQMCAITVFLCVAAGLARGQIQPRQANFPELRDEAKLRYLSQQLDLTPEQAKQVDGLLEVYAESVKSHNERVRNNVDRLRSMYAEMEEASKSGNKERAEQLRQEIQDFATNRVSEEEFATNLAALLTSEQKTLLEQARARLARNPSGELRPVDVFAVANQLATRDEQRSRLERLRVEFRTEVNNARSFTRQDRDRYLSALVHDVRAVLDEKQAAAFVARMQRMALPAQHLTPDGVATEGAPSGG
ncbi:MAG: hypothetical protein LC135_02450 [Phycisphaerae bacterium]|nr:hypothetical protein [Phycisphaerae bacterium]MCZ2398714.1 hypothetical protein [Phycisphaerae bacterium]